MLSNASHRPPRWNPVLFSSMVAATLVITAFSLIFWVAPREATMGDVQRIVYVHVGLAWCSLLGILATGACGLGYLSRRDLAWDRWAQSVAEVGWLCNTLTLATGSLWAHAAWNTWWTWDPRLTSTFILWLIYGGYLLLRSGLDDPHRRARLGAVLSLLGLLDVPMIVMATRWFRGMHPVAPQMDSTMRLVLVVSGLSLVTFFGLLAARRRRQLELAARLDALEQAGLDNQEAYAW